MPRTSPPPHGETHNQLLTRALRELQTISRQHVGEQVVVVTHGGLCYVLLSHILGSVDGDRREFTFGNASIHIIAVANDQWSVLSQNDMAHLQATE